MPAFPIVDAHVHLWNPDTFVIPWLAGNPMLDHRYLLNDFHAHSETVALDSFVYVEVGVDATFALAEARFAATLAEVDPRLRAIVAFAPVEHGLRGRGYLDALVATSPLVKGVRRMLQSEADATICLNENFVRGVQLLADYNLSFDICITQEQLTPVIELVRRCPETRFMLDHIAKPGIKSGMLDPWREQIAELADLPNVFCKISGLITEADHADWSPADLAPYVEHVLAVFGEDRVAYGGDWPVSLLASSYPRWVAALDNLTAHLPEAARRKLWVENAQQFYRLEDVYPDEAVEAITLA